MIKNYILPFLFAFSFFGYGQVSIAPYDGDILGLIQDNIIGNPNFPSFNYVVSTGINFGDVNGIATFNSVNTDLPFDEGIILTTGNVEDAPGPNSSTLSSGGGIWPGDNDLELILGNANGSSNNASLVQFDFTAEVDAISLEFMMASEEYFANLQCQFSDGFAFILSNLDTGETVNLALVPETSTAIAVTTVHPGVEGFCPPINEAYFDRYNYTDPTAGDTIDADLSPINFNGQTEVFLLMSDLIIGDEYRIKIVIADAQDTIFDSALFINKSSFGAFPIVENPPNALVEEDTNNDGLVTFDLTVNEAMMLGDVDTTTYSFLFSYHNSSEDAQDGINSIQNPEAYETSQDLETIYVRMANAYTGAATITNFRVANDSDLLGVNELLENEVTFFPIPIDDLLFIEGVEGGIDSIDIYSITGDLVSRYKASTNQTRISIDFSAFGNGFYFIKIVNANSVLTRKVLKN